MTLSAMSTGRFEIGRVVRRTFDTVRRNAALFLGLGALFVVAPRFAVYGLNATSAEGFRPAHDPAASVVATIAVVSLGWLLNASVIHAAAADLRGERPALKASLLAVLGRTAPVLSQALVTTLVLVASSFFLVAPAVLVAVLWVVATPALVIEGRGLQASYARSLALTKGRRWIIFATFVTLGLITVLGWAALVVVVGAMRLGLDAEARRAVIQYVLVPAGLAGFAVFSAAAVAAIYHELKTAREGEGAEVLAAAFD